MHPFQRTTLIRLGKCYSRIYAKVVDPNDIHGLRLFVIEILCILIRDLYATNIFNLTQHLLIHLVSELDACRHVGDVSARMAHGCVKRMGSQQGTSGGLHSEWVYEWGNTWIMHRVFLVVYTHSNQRVWECAKDEVVEVALEGKFKRWELLVEEMNCIHSYILHEAVEVAFERRWV